MEFFAYLCTQMENEMPAIVWLKVTNYMHGWIQRELGGGLRIGDQRVVSVQHLPGARDILSMEAAEGAQQHPVDIAMSAEWKNCIEAGLELEEGTMEREYGITRETLKLFIPIECPKMCLTKNGVLRPWTLDVCFSPRQASAMKRLLRAAFWDGVARYNREYALKAGGRKYPAIDMIEDFCAETKTPDIYADALRREWQRRVKRSASEKEP